MLPEPSSAPLLNDKLLPRDTRRALPIALLRAREAIMRLYRPVFRAYDVTEPQWRVMRALQEETPLDASEVSKRTCLQLPSLTRIFKTLDERGFISRKRDAGDARKLVLALTPSGLTLLCKLTPDAENADSQLERKFGRQRIEHLLELLGSFVKLGALR